MRTAAVWIERWLSEAGIPVKANLTDEPGLLARVRDSSFDMFILGSQLDPIPTYLRDIFHSQGPLNLGGFSNPELDAKADEFLAETNLNAAHAKAFELQTLIAEELPVVPLFNKPIQEAYLGEVGGLGLHRGPEWRPGLFREHRGAAFLYDDQEAGLIEKLPGMSARECRPFTWVTFHLCM